MYISNLCSVSDLSNNSLQMYAGLRRSANSNKTSKKQNKRGRDRRPFSQDAPTSVCAAERKTEAGNEFSLKSVQKRGMKQSTTQGDVMERACLVSAFPKCCYKCCGLTNCFKIGLVQQISTQVQLKIGGQNLHRGGFILIMLKQKFDLSENI